MVTADPPQPGIFPGEAPGSACPSAPPALIDLRDTYLSAIFHDLAQPLTVALGGAKLLQRRVTAGESLSRPDLAEELSLLASSIEDMAGMLTELQEIGHLRAGQQLPLHRRPIDLVPLLRELGTAWQEQTGRHVVRLVLGSDELVGAWDAIRLRRMVGNLLSNAIKYSPLGGEILIRAGVEDGGAAEGAWVILQIQDHGIGVPAADLPRVAEYSQRASNVVAKFPGRGLGLATVRRIALDHGGTFSLASEEGRGTTVTIRLPREEPHPAEPLGLQGCGPAGPQL